MKTLTIAFLLGGVLLAFGGEISEYHFKHARDKRGDQSRFGRQDVVPSTDHGITEIGIEHSGCFGSCPIYTLIVKSDGTFRYNGAKYVERKGEFKGTIQVWHFQQVAQFIRDSGYMELEDWYTRGLTDSATTYTLVVMGGKRKTVSNYANSGPSKLWAIEELIDGLMAKAQWARSQKAEEKKK